MTGSEERELKLQRYNRKVFGLKAYTYFWLPVILITSAYSLYSHYTHWTNDNFDFLFSLFSVVLAVISLVLIRGTDKYSFYSNVSLLVVCSIRYIVNDIIAILSINSLSTKLQSGINSAISGGQEAGRQIVSAGLGLGSGIVLFGVIISLLVFILFFSIYFYMFFKHKKLFFEFD